MRYISRRYAWLYLLLLSGYACAKEQTEQKPFSPCQVTCTASISTPDSVVVIEVLKSITKALAEHDFNAMAAYMDSNCTTFDEASHKLVIGREAIINDVKAKVTAEESRLRAPPIAFTIDHPYAKINGDQVVVTFVLVKEIREKKPAKFESHCSDVFIKRDGTWKKLHYCGDSWKRVK